jgi:hypothetical protein
MGVLDNAKDVRTPLRLRTMMEDAGLVNIEGYTIQLPLCDWPRGIIFRCQGKRTSIALRVTFFADLCCLLSSKYKLTRIAIADIREREIGQLNQENISKLLGSLSLFPFTQRLRMAIEEWLVLIAHARSEASNPAFKAYFPL